MRLLDKFKKKGFESENVKPENSEEIIVDRFPFADAPNTACFTCRHVLLMNLIGNEVNYIKL